MGGVPCDTVLMTQGNHEKTIENTCYGSLQTVPVNCDEILGCKCKTVVQDGSMVYLNEL